MPSRVRLLLVAYHLEDGSKKIPASLGADPDRSVVYEGRPTTATSNTDS
jgi:hypothetical protein